MAFLGVVAVPGFRYAFVIPMLLALASVALTRERRARVDKASELSHAYRGTALLLGSVIDADDGYTGYHSRGVVELAVAVADQLGLGDRARQLTEFAALLHDVGKIKVPKEIINKPGPLTPDEWDVVRRHPGDGADMLNGVGGFLAEVGDIVRHHHERWDGDGYPGGPEGRRDPRRSHASRGLRRLQRHHHRPRLPARPPDRRGDRGAAPQRRHAVRPRGHRRPLPRDRPRGRRAGPERRVDDREALRRATSRTALQYPESSSGCMPGTRRDRRSPSHRWGWKRGKGVNATAFRVTEFGKAW